MGGFKILQEQEVQIVHDWLRTMGMSVNRLLNREYADGFLIARLLKKMYPQLVNIHVYQPSYNYDVKATNWRNLNFKVLRRIGLSLTDEEMASLINGEPGSIEQLMWVIMNLSVEGRNFKLRARRRSPLTRKLLKRKTGIRKMPIETSPQRAYPPKAIELDLKSQQSKSSKSSEDNSLERTLSAESASSWKVPSAQELQRQSSSSTSSSPPLAAWESVLIKDAPKLAASTEQISSLRHDVSTAISASRVLSAAVSNTSRDISTIFSASSQCEDLEKDVAETYKAELESAQNRVQELEALIKKQDEILEMLRERANVYDSECREFHEVIQQVKAKTI